MGTGVDGPFKAPGTSFGGASALGLAVVAGLLGGKP